MRVRCRDLSVRLGPLGLEHPLINASGTMEIFDLAEVFGREILDRPPGGGLRAQDHHASTRGPATAAPHTRDRRRA